MLDSILLDLRFAARSLRRNRIATVSAVLTLAIGIGANTTVFTVADALLLRPPAGVEAPDRLVDVGRSQDGAGFDTNSYPNFLDVRARASSLAGMYAYPIEPQPVSVQERGGSATLAQAIPVSAGYFDVLGARPAAGRFFDARDGEQTGEPPLVVLSHRLWAERFASDPRVVGEKLSLNQIPFTVVGVVAPGFQGTTLLAPDLWFPLTMAPQVIPRLGPKILESRASAWLVMGGRLKPSVTLAQARAELASIGKSLAREFPADNAGRGLVATKATRFPGNIGVLAGFVGILGAIVGIVLMVACANIGGILLSRAVARRREIGVRLALGAGRGRLVRQLLTESALLFAIGGASGLVLARALVAFLRSLIPSLPVPVDLPVSLDGRVLAFSAALTLAACVLSGLAPALHAARGEVGAALQDGQGGSAGPGRLRLRHAFVVGQIAFSLVLVVTAGLVVRGLRRAGAVDPGFDAASVDLASFDLSLGTGSPEAARSAGETLLAAARRAPGIESAGLTAVVPLTGMGMGLGRLTAADAPPSPGEAFAADWNVVSPGYFATLRIPIAQGRDFSDADRAGAPDVAIVNQTAALRLWPGKDPIGRTLVQDDSLPGVASPGRTLRIVGIAKDGKYRSLDEPARAFIWVPFRQQFVPRMTLVARGRQGRRAAAALAVASKSVPGLPVLRLERLQDTVAVGLLPQRVAAGASGSLGAIGLLLAAIGVYGVTAYLVTRRKREIAIRIALGASPPAIRRMVLRESLALSGLGIAIGLVLSAAASGVLKSVLFGVPRLDPVSFGGAAAIFLAMAAAASWVPAARASLVRPIEALRND
jgi:putative ABC transport system permease protein